jgi:RNA polymerase sigma-70 factor, ECF subfamily
MSDPFRDPAELIRRVYGYVAFRIGDGPDAEDITGETFARALKYRASYDGSGRDAVPWLLGIARRCIAAHFAERITVVDVPAEIPVDSPLAETAALRLDVRRAVAGLGERDRELIALRYGSDLSAKQIAALLELQVNAVEVALHRAIGRLRIRLAEPAGEGHRKSGSSSTTVRT